MFTHLMCIPQVLKSNRFLCPLDKGIISPSTIPKLPHAHWIPTLILAISFHITLATESMRMFDLTYTGTKHWWLLMTFTCLWFHDVYTHIFSNNIISPGTNIVCNKRGQQLSLCCAGIINGKYISIFYHFRTFWDGVGTWRIHSAYSIPWLMMCWFPGYLLEYSGFSTRKIED